MQCALSLRRLETSGVHGTTEFSGLTLSLLKECLGLTRCSPLIQSN
jgi:hypothetical protein